MRNSMLKNLTMFILYSLMEIVICTTFIILAITIDIMLYIGTTISIVISIIYLCLLFWSPNISPFYSLVFDDQGFSILHFKKIKDRIDWNDLSNISYEFQGKIGFYKFSFKTKRQTLSIVYEKRLSELILYYCSNSSLLESIQ